MFLQAGKHRLFLNILLFGKLLSPICLLFVLRHSALLQVIPVYILLLFAWFLNSRKTFLFLLVIFDDNSLYKYARCLKQYILTL